MRLALCLCTLLLFTMFSLKQVAQIQLFKEKISFLHLAIVFDTRYTFGLDLLAIRESFN